jgi:protein-tyrosine-phosphatase
MVRCAVVVVDPDLPPGERIRRDARAGAPMVSLTADAFLLITNATTVYVMTEAQRDAVLEMVPAAAWKITRLDAGGDIPDPHGRESSVDCADRIKQAVQSRLVPA